MGFPRIFNIHEVIFCGCGNAPTSFENFGVIRKFEAAMPTAFSILGIKINRVLCYQFFVEFCTRQNERTLSTDIQELVNVSI